MHAEHDDNRDVRRGNEGNQVQYVGAVRTGDHLGDERENPVRCQRHDQMHKLHDDSLGGLYETCDRLAFLRIFLRHRERRDAEQDPEHHHRNDRRGACTSQIFEDVRRHETHEHVGKPQIGHGLVARR